MNNFDEWIKQNRPMIKHIVKQFNIPPTVEFDDLEQIAWYEIIKCVDKYDEQKGRFESYAYQCAYNGVLDYLNNNKNYHEDGNIESLKSYNNKLNSNIVQTLYRGIKEELKEKFQEAIVHYYGLFKNDSTRDRKEVANDLNITISCLDWRLTEAREQLRSWLKKNGYESHDFYSLLIETEHSHQKIVWS